jgi:peptide methionine sulfoxide reductase msrA/msrB
MDKFFKSYGNYLLLLIGGIIIVLIIITLPKLYNSESENSETITTEVEIPEGPEVATFAGGCFWCIEAVFQETEGISAAISGYAGGQEEDPTYEEVYTETTGHREAVQVFFDPEVITYMEIIDIYWKSIDPTDPGGQFVDRGHSYTTAIFYHNEEQKKIAEQTKMELEDSSVFEESIVTEILPFTTFYRAEEYHQDFYQKSSDRYQNYESASGREEFKEFVWGEIEKGN